MLLNISSSCLWIFLFFGVVGRSLNYELKASKGKGRRRNLRKLDQRFFRSILPKFNITKNSKENDGKGKVVDLKEERKKELIDKALKIMANKSPAEYIKKEKEKPMNNTEIIEEENSTNLTNSTDSLENSTNSTNSTESSNIPKPLIEGIPKALMGMGGLPVDPEPDEKYAVEIEPEEYNENETNSTNSTNMTSESDSNSSFSEENNQTNATSYPDSIQANLTNANNQSLQSFNNSKNNSTFNEQVDNETIEDGNESSMAKNENSNASLNNSNLSKSNNISISNSSANSSIFRNHSKYQFNESELLENYSNASNWSHVLLNPFNSIPFDSPIHKELRGLIYKRPVIGKPYLPRDLAHLYKYVYSINESDPLAPIPPPKNKTKECKKPKYNKEELKKVISQPVEECQDPELLAALEDTPIYGSLDADELPELPKPPPSLEPEEEPEKTSEEEKKDEAKAIKKLTEPKKKKEKVKIPKKNDPKKTPILAPLAVPAANASKPSAPAAGGGGGSGGGEGGGGGESSSDKSDPSDPSDPDNPPPPAPPAPGGLPIFTPMSPSQADQMSDNFRINTGNKNPGEFFGRPDVMRGSYPSFGVYPIGGFPYGFYYYHGFPYWNKDHNTLINGMKMPYLEKGPAYVSKFTVLFRKCNRTNVCPPGYICQDHLCFHDYLHKCEAYSCAKTLLCDIHNPYEIRCKNDLNELCNARYRSTDNSCLFADFCIQLGSPITHSRCRRRCETEAQCPVNHLCTCLHNTNCGRESKFCLRGNFINCEDDSQCAEGMWCYNRQCRKISTRRLRR